MHHLVNYQPGEAAGSPSIGFSVKRRVWGLPDGLPNLHMPVPPVCLTRRAQRWPKRACLDSEPLAGGLGVFLL